jgi:hypothetical protein
LMPICLHVSSKCILWIKPQSEVAIQTGVNRRFRKAGMFSACWLAVTLL